MTLQIMPTRSLCRAALLPIFLLVLFYSLTKIAQFQPEYHIRFDPSKSGAMAVVFLLSLAIGSVFYFARFSFGYLVGFYLYTSMVAFFWINAFNELNYDHLVALISAAASLTLFLAAALFVRLPVASPKISNVRLDRLPDLILCVSILVLAVAFADGAHFVGLIDMYKIRANIVHSQLTNYAIGNVTGALIPIAFACYLEQRRWPQLALLVLLSMLFYPVTLTKTAMLIGPFMVFVAILSSRLSARSATMFSLLVPLIVGAAAVLNVEWDSFSALRQIVFSLTSLRLFAIPADSLMHYYDFFSTHPLTYFCQISVVKHFSDCPYHDQLGVVFADVYRIGNMNASLFATEGIASVGPVLAPISALLCGLVVSIGNSASARLPNRFVLVSGSAVAITLLNVPLSTTILSNGMGLLLLAWYVLPRMSCLLEKKKKGDFGNGEYIIAIT